MNGGGHAPNNGYYANMSGGNNRRATNYNGGANGGNNGYYMPYMAGNDGALAPENGHYAGVNGGLVQGIRERMIPLAPNQDYWEEYRSRGAQPPNVDYMGGSRRRVDVIREDDEEANVGGLRLKDDRVDDDDNNPVNVALTLWTAGPDLTLRL